MAAYLIGLENRLENMSATSKCSKEVNKADVYDDEDDDDSHEDEETLVQQFQSNSYKQTDNASLLALQNAVKTVMLLKKAHKRFLHRERRLLDKSDEIKPITSLQPTNEVTTSSDDKKKKKKSLKLSSQPEDVFNELMLDRYAQKCVVGLTPADLKCEQLDYMLHSMKETFRLQMTVYLRNKDKLDNEIIRRIKNFSRNGFKEFSSEKIATPDSTKQFTNTLRSVLGHKRYFEIIKKSNLEDIYNQMFVSRQLARTTLKKCKQHREERNRLKTYSRQINFKSGNKIHYTLRKYNVPEAMKSIQLDETDFECAIRSINKDSQTDYTKLRLKEVLETFSEWHIDISLFIVLASLAERVKGLELLVKNAVCKIGACSLHAKIKNARELFMLIGVLDRRQHFQQLYTYQPTFKLNMNGVQTTSYTTDNGTSSKNNQRKHRTPKFQCLTNCLNILDYESSTPFGHIKVEDVKVFFYSANIREGHVQDLIRHLDHQNSGKIDFVTFIEYLPLFIESHKQIVCKPFLNLELFNYKE
ncbi:unnamed protein product [Heterobilharzia americana]|nr:unnamed protein product [Heterobilharzia americana]